MPWEELVELEELHIGGQTEKPVLSTTGDSTATAAAAMGAMARSSAGGAGMGVGFGLLNRAKVVSACGGWGVARTWSQCSSAYLVWALLCPRFFF